MFRDRRSSFDCAFTAPLPPLNKAIGQSSSPPPGSTPSLQLAPIDRRRSFLRQSVPSSWSTSSPGSSSSSDSRAASPVTSFRRNVLSQSASGPAFGGGSSFGYNSSSSTSSTTSSTSEGRRQSLFDSSPERDNTTSFLYGCDPAVRAESPVSFRTPASAPTQSALPTSTPVRSNPTYPQPSKAFRPSLTPKTPPPIAYPSPSAPFQDHYRGMLPVPQDKLGVTASKTRSTFSSNQIAVLEQLMSKAIYPSSGDIQCAIEATGMSEKQIKTWLSNRRAGRSGSTRKKQEPSEPSSHYNPGRYRF